MIVMNDVITKILSRLRYLFFALSVSIVLYLALPLSYFLFHSGIYRMANVSRNRAVAVDTMHLEKEKKREIREIRKILDKNPGRTRTSLASRFSLDLSLLSEHGSGTEIMDSREFNDVMDEGEADIPPIKRFFRMPDYPSAAQERGIEGTVVAKLLIDEQGNVLRVNIIKSPNGWGFDTAVREAALNWRFEPARFNNLPIRVWAIQVIDFRL